MEITTIFPKIQLFMGIFLAVSILVIVAIMLDLWDGVHTARITHQRVHSHKLRVTIAKMSEYWRFLIIAFLVDCIGIIFPFYIFPFVALLFGVGLIVIEIKSMFEHARRRKSHTGDLAAVLRQIIDCATEKEATHIIDLIKTISPTKCETSATS